MMHIPLQALVFNLCCASAFALTAQDIAKRADEIRGPGGSFTFQVRVTDFQDKKMVRENVYKVSSKDMKFSLVETIFPERLSGRKLLMAGALWLYLPTLKRPTRVGLQQRLTGEVANGDIARTNFHRDYVAKLDKIELIRSKPHYKLILTAKDKTLPYRKVHLWVDKTSFVPLKAEYFALSGRLLKTGEYSELQMVLGKARVTKLVIKDAIQPSKQSHLKYSKYQREQFDDSFFHKESLTE